MLVFLLVQLIRKIFTGVQWNKLIDLVKNGLFKLKYLAPFLLISMISPGVVENISENVEFEILNKDKIIGFITIDKRVEGKRTTYQVVSRVETKFLIKFKAIGNETSVYKNDTLVYSSMYRKVNKKIKVDQIVEFKDGNYYLDDKQIIDLSDPEIIRCNLVQLYFDEPVGISKVYCDKQKRFLNVDPIEEGKYKVQFKRGNYSVFNYKNGKCISIDAVGTFFKVRLSRTEQDQS